VNLCNADLNSCYFGYGYLALVDRWAGGVQIADTDCRCYHCVKGLSGIAVNSYESSVWVRDGWAIAINTNDKNASGLVLRNGTVLDLSLVGSLKSLTMIPKETVVELLEHVPIGDLSTETAARCTGSNPCSWEYSYAETTTHETSNSIGFSASVEVSAEFWGVGVTATMGGSTDYSWGDSKEKSASTTVGGEMQPGQIVKVDKQKMRLTFRTTTVNQVYGALKAVRANPSPYCVVQDIGQILADSQMSLRVSQDGTSKVDTYSVSSGAA